MAKKNSGKKMIGKGLVGTAGGYAAANAILAFAPVCPLAFGAWLLANGAMAAGTVTTVAGGVKSVYDAGYNKANNENFNDKCKVNREKAMDDDIKNFKDYQLYKAYSLVIDIIEDNGINEDGIKELLNLKNIGTNVQFIRKGNAVGLAEVKEFVNKEINYEEVKEILTTIAAVMSATKNHKILVELIKIIKLSNFDLQQKLKLF